MIEEKGKLSHRLILLCIKYVPAIAAIMEFLATIFLYFGVGIGSLSVMFGTSILSLIPMYIASYVFKFCKYHRMILNYVALNKALYLIDLIFVLPITDFYFVLFYVVITGIFLSLTIYNYMKYGDRDIT